jgi:hypothetical protein
LKNRFLNLTARLYRHAVKPTHHFTVFKHTKPLQDDARPHATPLPQVKVWPAPIRNETASVGTQDVASDVAESGDTVSSSDQILDQDMQDEKQQCTNYAYVDDPWPFYKVCACLRPDHTPCWCCRPSG